MNTDWRRSSLIDFAHLVSTGPFGSMLHKSDYVSDGVPLVNPVNIVNDRIVPNIEKQVDFDTQARISRYVLKAGDVVVARRGEIGRCAVVDESQAGWICGTGCFFVRPRAEIDSSFLAQLLRAPQYREQLEREATGATMPNMSNTALAQLSINVPPLYEQRRIVAILDEAFEGIATAKANAEKNLQKARELFDGYLREFFREPGITWTQEIVEEHIRFIDYRGKTPQKTSEGLRLITAKNVKKGFIQEEPMEFVAPDSYDGWMTRGIPNRGDVLFTTEAPLGNVAQLDTAERVVFAQRIIVMQADPAILDSAFLKYMLLSEPMQAKLHAKATGATAQGIKASLLKRIPIAFPTTLGEQTAIVDRLDSLAEETSRLEELYAAKLSALDELKRSLLHQAFSGGLS